MGCGASKNAAAVAQPTAVAHVAPREDDELPSFGDNVNRKVEQEETKHAKLSVAEKYFFQELASALGASEAQSWLRTIRAGGARPPRGREGEEGGVDLDEPQHQQNQRRQRREERKRDVSSEYCRKISSAENSSRSSSFRSLHRRGEDVGGLHADAAFAHVCSLDHSKNLAKHGARAGLLYTDAAHELLDSWDESPRPAAEGNTPTTPLSNAKTQTQMTLKEESGTYPRIGFLSGGSSGLLSGDDETVQTLVTVSKRAHDVNMIQVVS